MSEDHRNDEVDQKRLEQLTKQVAKTMEPWIQRNAKATLGDLHIFLEDAYSDAGSFEEDDLVDESHDEMGEAGDYLNYTEGENVQTFEELSSMIEDDMGNVQELVEILGDQFPVSKLTS